MQLIEKKKNAWYVNFSIPNPDPKRHWRVNKRILVIADTANCIIIHMNLQFPDALIESIHKASSNDTSIWEVTN